MSEYAYLLLFLIGGLIFIVIGLMTGALIRPHRPNEEKLTTYECGEDVSGNAWGGFNIRFYVVALIFVLFDVELVFLFPWATVFGQHSLMQQTEGLWGWFAFFEMFIFVFVLALGLAYAWKQGHLSWVRPKVVVPEKPSAVPEELYEKVNEKY